MRAGERPSRRARLRRERVVEPRPRRAYPRPSPRPGRAEDARQKKSAHGDPRRRRRRAPRGRRLEGGSATHLSIVAQATLSRRESSRNSPTRARPVVDMSSAPRPLVAPPTPVWSDPGVDVNPSSRSESRPLSSATTSLRGAEDTFIGGRRSGTPRGRWFRLAGTRPCRRTNCRYYHNTTSSSGPHGAGSPTNFPPDHAGPEQAGGDSADGERTGASDDGSVVAATGPARRMLRLQTNASVVRISTVATHSSIGTAVCYVRRTNTMFKACSVVWLPCKSPRVSMHGQPREPRPLHAARASVCHYAARA